VSLAAVQLVVDTLSRGSGARPGRHRAVGCAAMVAADSASVLSGPRAVGVAARDSTVQSGCLVWPAPRCCGLAPVERAARLAGSSVAAWQPGAATDSRAAFSRAGPAV